MRKAFDCTNCGKPANPNGWGLHNYYGITGYFCNPCYELVSHDAYKNPNHPGAYIAILLKHQCK